MNIPYDVAIQGVRTTLDWLRASNQADDDWFSLTPEWDLNVHRATIGPANGAHITYYRADVYRVEKGSTRTNECETLVAFQCHYEAPDVSNQ